jgi:hypothetical protein
MMARPTVLPMMTVDVDGIFGDSFSDGIDGFFCCAGCLQACVAGPGTGCGCSNRILSLLVHEGLFFYLMQSGFAGIFCGS